MKTFEVQELQPTNGQKSFYQKALVITTDNVSRLKSYNTIVAEYNHETKKIQVFGWYSKTTAFHINAFLNLYGFDSCNKKQLQNYK